MDVAYHFYASGSTVLQADRYTFDGSNWIKNLTYETLDGPFKKVSGKWNFDPSMTLVVAPDRSAYSKSFYQACVDWVLQNKDAAYTTDNRSGSRLTDAEYYSGCAASYTNLNLAYQHASEILLERSRRRRIGLRHGGRTTRKQHALRTRRSTTKSKSVSAR